MRAAIASSCEFFLGKEKKNVKQFNKNFLTNLNIFYNILFSHRISQGKIAQVEQKNRKKSAFFNAELFPVKNLLQAGRAGSRMQGYSLAML